MSKVYVQKEKKSQPTSHISEFGDLLTDLPTVRLFVGKWINCPAVRTSF